MLFKFSECLGCMWSKCNLQCPSKRTTNWHQFSHSGFDDQENPKLDAANYRGMQTKTISGIECAKWTDNEPVHDFKPAKFPNAGLGEHNYCRSVGFDYLWCYTKDPKKRWENCVPLEQEQYNGFQSKTRSGKSCMKWTVQTPHRHDFTPARYPHGGLGDHNYCRGTGWPFIWCYTTDPSVRWESCTPVEQPRQNKMAIRSDGKCLTAYNSLGAYGECDANGPKPCCHNNECVSNESCGPKSIPYDVLYGKPTPPANPPGSGDIGKECFHYNEQFDEGGIYTIPDTDVVQHHLLSCFKACNVRPDCDGFEFNRESGICVLKSGICKGKEYDSQTKTCEIKSKGLREDANAFVSKRKQYVVSGPQDCIHPYKRMEDS